MTLKLLSFLDASFDKHIRFEIRALVEKKPPKPREKLRKKPYIQLVKKFPKFAEKTRRENQRFD